MAVYIGLGHAGQALHSKASRRNSGPVCKALWRAQGPSRLRHGGIRVRLGVFEGRQDRMQRGNQLLARDMALAELDAHAEGIVLRLKIEDERLGARCASGLLTAFAASLVPREPAPADARHRLQPLFP